MPGAGSNLQAALLLQREGSAFLKKKGEDMTLEALHGWQESFYHLRTTGSPRKQENVHFSSFGSSAMRLP